jgi:hypothetical protein
MCCTWYCIQGCHNDHLHYSSSLELEDVEKLVADVASMSDGLLETRDDEIQSVGKVCKLGIATTRKQDSSREKQATSCHATDMWL